MTKEQELKFEELCKDKVFAEKLLKCETPESAQELLATNGIELDIDEIKAFGEMLSKYIEKMQENGGELSEEDLEEITGGILIAVSAAVFGKVCWGIVIAGGISIGSLIGFLHKW